MRIYRAPHKVDRFLFQNIGPRWLALNLAGLYWRVKGYPRQALYCLMESVLNSVSLFLVFFCYSIHF